MILREFVGKTNVNIYCLIFIMYVDNYIFLQKLIIKVAKMKLSEVSNNYASAIKTIKQAILVICKIASRKTVHRNNSVQITKHQNCRICISRHFKTYGNINQQNRKRTSQRI